MILTYDIETYKKSEDGKLEPILNCQEFALGAIHKETGVTEFFTEPTKMAMRLIELIEKERRRGKRTFIYGHNSQYDFYGVFRDLLKENLIMHFDGGKQIKYLCFYPFMAMYGKQSDNWRFDEDAYFLDSMGYYRMPLSDVATMFGMEKLEMPEKVDNVEGLKEYLKRDVEVVMNAMKEMRATLKWLGFQPKRLLTAGNTSITCFLTWCKKNKLLWAFSDKGRTYQGKNILKIRPSFRGGRTECFRTGLFENCIKIDCNAMYPYIMTQMEFPNLKSEFYVEGMRAENYLDKIGVVECTIKAPTREKLDYGYLPIRFGGLVHFPLDCEMTGTWTTLEIRKAMKLGYELINIKWGVFYHTSRVNPFKDYMEHLWKMRQQATGVKKQVIKLLMNSLYGKWAQYRADEDLRLIERGQLREYEEKGYSFVKTSGNKYIVGRMGEMKLPRYANPMISILITAQGRDYLYDTMCKIPREELVYVATDGLIVQPRKQVAMSSQFSEKEENCSQPKDLNSFDAYDIRVSDELGSFKIEDKGTCEMYGENKYRFNNNIKVGGVPKRDMTLEVLKGEKKVETSKIIGIKEAMLNAELRNKVGTFREEQIKLSISCKNSIALPKVISELGYKQDGGWSIK